MPDSRRHRGPHPEDRELFGAAARGPLQAAVTDLSWLLDSGYAANAALKLVGDRFALRERQRRAVLRSSCTDAQRQHRASRRADPTNLRGATVWIDGFNVLTTVEAALSGGVLLRGRDGALRDMASMHGSYRKVEETIPAIHCIAECITDHGLTACRWLLDAPVSNSGRLKTRILGVAKERGLDWTVDVVADPDAVLIEADGVVVASADARILDLGGPSWNLAAAAVARCTSDPWLVDLSGG